MTMRLFVELFVRDLHRSRVFYHTVLGLEIDREDDDIVVLRRDQLRLHLLPLDDLPPALPGGQTSPLGSRVEFVIEVDDIHAFEAHVRRTGWPIRDPLQERPWRRVDFRIEDPDGAYLRITSVDLSATCVEI